VNARVAVVGAGVHLPGGGSVGGLDLPAGKPPELIHEVLGRKGLLAKDRATRLALAAVHAALGLPVKAPRTLGPVDERTAVVVSSNLGSVATMASVVRTVRAGSGHDVSPLDAPNVSSNVIASTIAIRHRFGGPNITVCSGASSGLQAVALGSLLLRAGRADRVVVVGVEPDDDVAAALHRHRAAAPTAKLRAVAACVLLAWDATAPALGRVGTPDTAPHQLWVGGHVLDPRADLGDAYGAAGVLNLALALRAVEAGYGDTAQVGCGDAVDGWQTVELTRGRP
jgi:3-oxoacyl-[acyl-carrier-protein] synthase II